MNFIIERGGEIKEAFGYDRSLIEATLHALEEYARFTYGDDAVLRPMTQEEETEFMRHGSEFFNKSN
jgi:hypothetical protein